MEQFFYSKYDLHRLAKTTKIRPHTLKLALYFITKTDEQGNVEGKTTYDFLSVDTGLALTTINRCVQEMLEQNLMVNHIEARTSYYRMLSPNHWKI